MQLITLALLLGVKAMIAKALWVNPSVDLIPCSLSIVSAYEFLVNFHSILRHR